MALLILSSPPLSAGTLEDDFFVGTAGDGLIFADPAEGVLEPGLKAVTFTRTRVSDGEDGWIYVDPYEEIITDFSDLESRGDVTNCLMSNNPEVFCDSEGGSGKRIKTQLTGPTPFDIILRSTPSDDYPMVDYFTFGKTSNFTGARIIGFTVELLDGDGNPMGLLDPENAVLYNLEATDIGIGARLPDGLFGAGGQEGDIGFFSEERAGLARIASSDVLDFGALSNAEYVEHFGTAFLDDSMTPDGLFWDDNGDPTDESALIAWYNPAGGGWTYGNLDIAENLDARLDELASALGVDVADLDYAAGGLVPDDIVAAAEANGLFEVGAIEDLRNANLNFTITVGNVDGEEFILRFTPTFADIVEMAATPFQFTVAGNLDAANVPYLGVDEAYLGIIDDVMALGTEEEQQAALESLGFSFAGAPVGLAQDFGSDVIFALSRAQAAVDEGVVSRGAGTWAMGDGTSGFVAIGGGQTEKDATLNSAGYESDRFSFVGGFETTLNSGWNAGLALGWHEGDSEIDGDLGTIEAEGLTIAGHARNQLTDRAQIGVVLGYQDLSYDSARNIVFGSVDETATGSTDGQMIFAGIQGQSMATVSWGRWGPVGSLEYYNVSVDGYTETGAGIYNLAVEDYESDLLIGRLALRGELAERNMSNGWAMQAYGQAGLALRSGGDFTVNAAFDGSNLPTMALPADGGDSEWLELGFGVALNRNSFGNGGSTFGFDYRGAFADGAQSHQGKLQFTWTF